MIVRINRLQIKVYIKILEKRIGICSQKETLEDKHILLWDFDNAELSEINFTLSRLLKKYNLPAIYIIMSSTNSYHAYCFVSRSFREIIHILTDTPEIDMVYLKLGMVRGYYTLRISERTVSEFKIVNVLKSKYQNEMAWNEITINEYLTSNKGGHGNA